MQNLYRTTLIKLECLQLKIVLLCTSLVATAPAFKKIYFGEPLQ
jgi:hypothetical protein